MSARRWIGIVAALAACTKSAPEAPPAGAAAAAPAMADALPAPAVVDALAAVPDAAVDDAAPPDARAAATADARAAVVIDARVAPVDAAPAPGPVDAAPPIASGPPCRHATFETTMMADACARGGQAAAKADMKKFVRGAKAREPALECGTCHAKLAPAYPLKPDGLAHFKKLGGT